MDSELLELFAEELNPVASKAQRKVPVPEGLDLTAWINDPPEAEEDHTAHTGDDVFFVEAAAAAAASPAYKAYESDDEGCRALCPA